MLLEGQNSLVGQFSVPDMVGQPMGLEAITAIVQENLRRTAEALDCCRLIAFAFAPKEGMLRGISGVNLDMAILRDIRLSLSDFPAADRALRTGQVGVLENASLLPNVLGSLLNGETIVVPLILGSRPLAVLVGQVASGVGTRSPLWQEQARQVIEQAALVIEVQRASVAFQNELRLRYASREIIASLLEGNPIGEIAESMTAMISQLLRVDRVALALQDEAGNLRPLHLRNVRPEYLGANISRLLHQHPVLSRAVATGIPHYIPDLQRDMQISAEKRALLARDNITSLLLAPLHYAEFVQGVLAIYLEAGRELTLAERSVFQSFADMATLGVAVSHQMEQQRSLAQADERNRLAREMHDTVAQSLAALSLQLETAQSYLDSNNHAEAREMLTASRALAKKALQDTRRAVQGLAPASLETLTATQAIAEEVRQFEAETGVPAQYLLSGEEVSLTPEQDTALLRIAQEALTNARKHAQARRVRVGIQFAEESVTLLVEDDGVGFDTEALAAPGPEGGYGLFGMQERARLLEGEVNIESTLQWGTRIQARLPVRPLSPVRPPQLRNPGTRTTSLDSPAITPESGLTSVRPDTLSRIRVLIADDHAITRQGLRSVLEASGEIVVVGEASDGGEAAESARTLRPDVVLMDIQMPRVDGLEGLRRIHAEQPELPVVILTSFQTEETVREALKCGAKGFQLKGAESADLIATVRTAYRGDTVFASSVAEQLTAIAQGEKPETIAGLNERTLEVLALIVEGARNKEIAARLFISERTVEYHLSNIFRALNVSNRTEAANAARERGLIPSAS